MRRLRHRPWRPVPQVAEPVRWMILLTVGGCSLALPYEAPAPEADVDTCRDGIDNDLDGLIDCNDDSCDDACSEAAGRGCADLEDNDLDGLVDCDDPDCDGQCPELDPDACSDGRDNDGDGATDVEDLACWAHTATDGSACGSQLGVDEMTDASGLGVDWVGDAVVRDDLPGLEGTPVIAGADGRERAFVVSGTPLLGGGIFQTSARVVAGDDTDVSFGVYRDDDFVIGEAFSGPAVFVTVFAGRARAALVYRDPVGAEETVDLELSRPLPRVVDLTVRTTSSGVVQGFVGDEIGGIGSGSFDATLFDDTELPLRSRWDARGAVARSGLLIARETREPFDPCGFPVPQLGESRTSTGLAAASAEDGTTCAAMVDGPEPRALATHRFLEVALVSTRVSALDEPIDELAMARNEPDETWGLLVAFASEGGGVGVALYESTDCRAWRPRPAMFEGLPRDGVALAAGLSRTADGWLGALVVDTGTRVQVIPLEPQGADVYRGGDRGDLGVPSRVLDRLGPLTRLGDGWAALHPFGSGLAIWGGPIDGITVLRAPFVDASNRATAFDARQISAGTLLFEGAPDPRSGRWEGLLLYAGRRTTGCQDCARVGLVPFAVGGEP